MLSTGPRETVRAAAVPVRPVQSGQRRRRARRRTSTLRTVIRPHSAIVIGAAFATRWRIASVRAAKLRHVGSSIEDVDYPTPQQMACNLFRQIALGGWISKRQNLIITGPCGVGNGRIHRGLHQAEVEAVFRLRESGLRT